MDKLLPIVAGCKAVIIDAHPDDMWKEVVVGSFLGDLKDEYYDPNQWSIDIPIKIFYGNNIDTFCGEYDRQCGQSELMRIDGNEDQFSEEENSRVLERVKCK